MMDKVALGQMFLQVLRLDPVRTIPSIPLTGNKEFNVLPIQSNTTIFYLVVQ